MKETLNYLFEHKTLSRIQAKELLTGMASGSFSEPEMAACLTVFNMRAIKVEELTGFREALLALCVQVDLSDFNTIDLCGTGGDGKNTFNISTLTSFVLAGAGYKVAKHGNYGVSSACGSSNVLEYLGYQFTQDADRLKTELDKAGLCYMHAPLFHPAMKAVGPVRRQLKVKTFFNMLGPMVNPSSPNNQLVGVFSLELARLYQYLYQQLDKQYVIIHAMDGYDEVSLTGGLKAISNTTEEILEPASFGFEAVSPKAIHGGNTVKEAARIFLDVLENKGTQAQTHVVLANSALAIRCFHPHKELQACVEEARQSLQGGKAMKVLKLITGGI